MWTHLLAALTGMVGHIGECRIDRADAFLLAAHLMAGRQRIVSISAAIAKAVDPVGSEVGDDFFAEPMQRNRERRVQSLRDKRRGNLLPPLPGLAHAGIGDDAGYGRAWGPSPVVNEFRVGVEVEQYAAFRVIEL
jgi:hypothetical protein